MLSLVVALIVLLVLIWAVQKLIAAFGIAEPIATVIWVLFVLIAVAYVLNAYALVPHLLR